MWCDIPLYATMIVCWEAHYKDNKSIMKQKIKALSKRLAIILTLVVVVIAIVTGTYEGYVRPVAVEYLAKEDAPRATSTKEVVVSEYDIWMASEDTKRQIDLLYKQYTIAQKEEELAEAKKVLESEKEALRAQELSFR